MLRHRHHLLAVALALISALGLLCAPLFATSFVVVADEALADQAESIVRGEILDATVSEASGPIATDYRVLVREAIRGEAPSAPIVVRVLGGELPDGRGLQLWGLPRFERGERVFFFLRSNGDGTFRILHLFQGAFREVELSGGSVLVRSFDGASRLPAPGSGQAAEVGSGDREGRDAERFAGWLRDRAVGEERPADYLVHAPLELLPSYTLLGDGVQRLFRWFEFDAGQEIVWHRHESGQRGLADGGVAPFAVAMKLWNDDPDTPVHYVDGGTTDATGAFARQDGFNTILFDDRGNTIADDFSCTGGGTVAVGGVSFVKPDGRAWKGRTFEPTLEAEVIINDGVDCYFSGRPERAEEAYAHELGHTLGLGHACGDGASPSCFRNTEADEALMRAALHNDRRGALLNRDDRAGLRYLYNPAPDGPSCPWPLGHKRFCLDCGPCGPGEGDCDASSECVPNLVCDRLRGADFGLDPKADICVDADDAVGSCPRPFGHRRYCRQCGPCAAGDGGCVKDRDCQAGLVCVKRVGADFGFAPKIGVCLPAPSELCPLKLGKKAFCAVCGPCRLGEGGCDSNDECGGALACVRNAGEEFGLPRRTDVCM